MYDRGYRKTHAKNALELQYINHSSSLSVSLSLSVFRMKLPEILKPLENKEELKTKGLALFAKLIRTKNVEKLQGETVIPGRKTTDDKKQKLQVG